MNERIKPPVAADLDVRKFPYMPLYITKLLNSEFLWTVTDAEYRAATLLWFASWHQVPAGSVPSSDRTLAGIAGLGKGDDALEQWQAIKVGALYGFRLATDGRYYHPIIVDAAKEAAARINKFAKAREESARRMNKTRAARKQQSDQSVVDDEDNVARNVRATFAQRCGDVARLKEREGKGNSKSVPVDRAEQRTQTHASPGEPGDGVGWVEAGEAAGEFSGPGAADLPSEPPRASSGQSEASKSQSGAGAGSGIGRAGPTEPAGEFFGRQATQPPEATFSLTGGPSSAKPKGSQMKTGRKYPAAFEAFWLPYPRKVGKEAAFKAWTGAKKHTDPVIIASGAAKFATVVKQRGTPNDKIPHPSTWLNAGRWMDDEAANEKANAVPFNQRPGNKFVF